MGKRSIEGVFEVELKVLQQAGDLFGEVGFGVGADAKLVVFPVGEIDVAVEVVVFQEGDVLLGHEVDEVGDFVGLSRVDGKGVAGPDGRGGAEPAAAVGVAFDADVVVLKVDGAIEVVDGGVTATGVAGEAGSVGGTGFEPLVLVGALGKEPEGVAPEGEGN